MWQGRISQKERSGRLRALAQAPLFANLSKRQLRRCLTLSRGDFVQVLEGEARLAVQILREVAGRLRRTSASRSAAFSP